MTNVKQQFQVLTDEEMMDVSGGGNNTYNGGHKFGRWLRGICENYLFCAKTVYAPTIDQP